ncbi:phage holin [Clostridium sp. SHJSY1]|uniref:phage holin n=1 Tax=Clostridium sp. SHJSY1 TaxID=2942483 RepID=UPI0028741C5D|nr:phage holin [Clostridium sp. SHJSY1]MDS0525742.1 phage holin [Clostridium sp. SHJSY1]
MLDKSRFKNHGLWISIAALIPMILKSAGLDILPDNYETIMNLVLGILVTLGILNNPTTECRWFSDDKKESEENNS